MPGAVPFISGNVALSAAIQMACGRCIPACSIIIANRREVKLSTFQTVRQNGKLLTIDQPFDDWRYAYAEYDDLSDWVKFKDATVDSLDQSRALVGIGASMSQGKTITRSPFGLVAVCAFAISGCAATMIPSKRLHEPELSKVMRGTPQIGGHRAGMLDASECTACEDRQRLQDYAHDAMPYVAGPFMHPRVEPEIADQQATIQPPHSKFHPVPTRPVFETRASYLLPQPIGVHLVPVPDQGIQSIVPRSRQADSLPGPSVPTAESNRGSDFDGEDTIITSPPSN